MITSFDDLLDRMRQGPRVTVAVAAADDEAALGAVAAAHELGIADALLFGDGTRISAVYKEMTGSPDLPFEIREAAEEQAARTAVAAVRSGAAQILLKGKIKTAALLKAVLDSEHGLRSSRQLSDLFIFEDPSRAGNKLVMITDGGVTLKPDLKQKIEIIENAVAVARALGNDSPRVAVLSAVETVNPALPATIDAAVLTKMNQRARSRAASSMDPSRSTMRSPPKPQHSRESNPLWLERPISCSVRRSNRPTCWPNRPPISPACAWAMSSWDRPHRC